MFCAIVELTRRDENEEIGEHFYRYYDAWPIHPSTESFTKALKAWSKLSESKIKERELGDYFFPQGLLNLRLMPPPANKVDKEIKATGEKFVNLDLVDKNEVVYPIVAGRPSLFLFCSDVEVPDEVTSGSFKMPQIGKMDGFSVKRGRKKVNVVKLWQLAQVRQGLATADDEHFLRKSPGVVANARRKNIKDVDMRVTLTTKGVARLSKDQRENGIQVTDRKRNRYFVPLDKGGESDPHGGELRSFWSPVDYWIDWSKGSVSLLKKRDKWKPGTPKKPRFQNRKHYFKSGIRFSRAGLYAPTFELGFGGVFSDKGSLIIPFSEDITKYLLGVLCSPLIRYLTKNFLQHTVMTEIDIIRQIPIAVPTQKQFNEVVKNVDAILVQKQKGKSGEKKMEECWRKIYSIYGIPREDRKEVETWFKRRYPHFGKGKN